MLRELLHIGPVTIYGYGLMIAIGVISCVLVGMNRAKKLGVNPDILFNAAFIGIIFGIIGAKLMYWITIFPDIIKNPKLLLDLTGGFVVYGGLVLGVGFFFFVVVFCGRIYYFCDINRKSIKHD